MGSSKTRKMQLVTLKGGASDAVRAQCDCRAAILRSFCAFHDITVCTKDPLQAKQPDGTFQQSDFYGTLLRFFERPLLANGHRNGGRFRMGHFPAPPPPSARALGEGGGFTRGPGHSHRTYKPTNTPTDHITKIVLREILY